MEARNEFEYVPLCVRNVNLANRYWKKFFRCRLPLTHRQKMTLFTRCFILGGLLSTVLGSQQTQRQHSSKATATSAGQPGPPGGSYGGTAVGGGQRELRYVVQEEMTVGSIIADIVDDADLNFRYGPQIAQSTAVLRYRFMPPPRIAVAVNETTGHVITTGRIDRESICGGVHVSGTVSGQSSPASAADPCLIRLDVVITPINYFHIVKVGKSLQKGRQLYTCVLNSEHTRLQATSLHYGCKITLEWLLYRRQITDMYWWIAISII